MNLLLSAKLLGLLEAVCWMSGSTRHTASLAVRDSYVSLCFVEYQSPLSSKFTYTAVVEVSIRQGISSVPPSLRLIILHNLLKTYRTCVCVSYDSQTCSYNIYAVQQDTQIFFNYWVYSSHMLTRHVSDLTGPSSGTFFTSCMCRFGMCCNTRTIRHVQP